MVWQRIKIRIPRSKSTIQRPDAFHRSRFTQHVLLSTNKAYHRREFDFSYPPTIAIAEEIRDQSRGRVGGSESCVCGDIEREVVASSKGGGNGNG